MPDKVPFCKSYIGKKAWREGLIGWFIANNGPLDQFMSYPKCRGMVMNDRIRRCS